MQPLDEQELIERYLSDALTVGEAGELEARMKNDPSFRTRVELHRQLHAEFSDPQKLALRNMLSDIVEETPVQPRSGKGWWMLGLLIGVVALGVWYFRSVTPVPEAPSSITPTEQEKNEQPIQQTTPATPEPIAKADGPSFKPNQAFESRLGNGGIRSEDGEEVIMQSPRPNAVLTLKNQNVALTFKGRISVGEEPQEMPLAIRIYNNQPDSKSFMELRAVVKKDQDNLLFSAAQNVKLAPGVYYYTLEQTETRDLIYVGKFTVREE
jgi:hypothetical protein